MGTHVDTRTTHRKDPGPRELFCCEATVLATASHSGLLKSMNMYSTQCLVDGPFERVTAATWYGLEASRL